MTKVWLLLLASASGHASLQTPIISPRHPEAVLFGSVRISFAGIGLADITPRNLKISSPLSIQELTWRPVSLSELKNWRAWDYGGRPLEWHGEGLETAQIWRSGSSQLVCLRLNVAWKAGESRPVLMATYQGKDSTGRFETVAASRPVPVKGGLEQATWIFQIVNPQAKTCAELHLDCMGGPDVILGSQGLNKGGYVKSGFDFHPAVVLRPGAALPILFTVPPGRYSPFNLKLRLFDASGRRLPVGVQPVQRARSPRQRDPTSIPFHGIGKAVRIDLVTQNRAALRIVGLPMQPNVAPRRR